MDLIALSDAWKASIALIAVFGVIFPALATGLLVFAVARPGRAALAAERRRPRTLGFAGSALARPARERRGDRRSA